MRSVFAAALAFSCFGASIDDQDFNGRWDITVTGGSSNTPASQRGWWLEVAGAGTENLRGRFLGAPVGLLDEIPKLSISEGELRFALEAKFRKDHAQEKGLYWARFEEGKLKGTFEIAQWTGRGPCERSSTVQGEVEELLEMSNANSRCAREVDMLRPHAAKNYEAVLRTGHRHI